MSEFTDTLHKALANAKETVEQSLFREWQKTTDLTERESLHAQVQVLDKLAKKLKRELK